MGRPIKKSFIGNTSVDGQQIECSAFVPGDSQARTSYIQEQLGTGRYYVVSVDGLHEGVVTLANKASGDLVIGEASVTVSPFFDTPATQYAQVIYDNTVRTFEGRHYIWYFTGTTTTEVNGANISSS